MMGRMYILVALALIGGALSACRRGPSPPKADDGDITVETADKRNGSKSGGDELKLEEAFGTVDVVKAIRTAPSVTVTPMAGIAFRHSILKKMELEGDDLKTIKEALLGSARK